MELGVGHSNGLLQEYYISYLIVCKRIGKKNSLPENTTKLGGRDSICFGYYPTQKAIQIEKTLYCHVLLGMLALLQNQMPSQTIYP